MIRVIIEHQVKGTKDIESVIETIRELRNEAMKRPGYLTGETLANTEDDCNILVISTWRSLEDWKEWDTSELRTKITQKIKALLVKPYTVRSFQYYLVREKRVWSTF